ncbi:MULTISPECIES: aminotransferase class V-fold PLP-dependent enzyme [unclassified Shinella]|uniref:aminotransferase class V-fold PLP-dependent enzyme n=1 Tax=unclassified Shinella TaxID=2643062 RepID=UPI00225D9489|nr:aminotransferase class V-fold PLP-dependent enzyme [Shinella sp. YE25]MDC7260179.1 aminotransferase class V-fold PLP-dependent enzyme [Shinella sp. YE25]CAI0341063.1 Cysteine desulfurase [Rhizobiaceae bacterium]CAK7262105.1 Selenocysteine lyase/cysteine desulfurase [Shinella sp. WSC3-e]
MTNQSVGNTSHLKKAPDDEAYWLSVRETMDPLYVNTQLVNTRRGPAPLSVREKVRALVDLSLSYELDEYEPFKALKESGSSVEIRSLLADYFGASANEIALTRNAMEGIATVLNGFDMKPGEEMLATKFCYDSNLAIMRQRARRDDITIKLVELPFGPASEEEILTAFENAISEKTRLLSVPHVIARTGLVLPVKAISELARSRGIFTFVDGAHSAGHLDLKLDDLGCDGYAACLHKWMYGPRGTGFLHVRKDQIAKIWPLFASWSNKPADSIEKFEEVGTVFKALPASIPEMISFNRDIGQAEKSARLRYLRDRWASRLRHHERIRLLTDIDAAPGTSFGGFVVEGMDAEHFARVLLDEFDIHVKAFTMEEDASMTGIHLSPGLANTVEEIDSFVEATLAILARSHNSFRQAV